METGIPTQHSTLLRVAREPKNGFILHGSGYPPWTLIPPSKSTTSQIRNYRSCKYRFGPYPELFPRLKFRKPEECVSISAKLKQGFVSFLFSRQRTPKIYYSYTMGKSPFQSTLWKCTVSRYDWYILTCLLGLESNLPKLEYFNM